MTILSRRRFLVSAGLTALGSLLMSCGAAGGAALAEARSSKPRQSDPQAAPDDLQAFAAGHNAFGLGLYGLLRGGGGNLFFSPYSIAQVLTMTSAGARGQTLAQMAQALHASLPPERLHPAANALDQALTNRGAEQDGFKLEIPNQHLGPERPHLPAGVPRHAGHKHGAGPSCSISRPRPIAPARRSAAQSPRRPTIRSRTSCPPAASTP